MFLGSARTPETILIKVLQPFEVIQGSCGPRISILGLMCECKTWALYPSQRCSSYLVAVLPTFWLSLIPFLLGSKGRGIAWNLPETTSNFAGRAGYATFPARRPPGKRLKSGQYSYQVATASLRWISFLFFQMTFSFQFQCSWVLCGLYLSDTWCFFHPYNLSSITSVLSKQVVGIFNWFIADYLPQNICSR